MIGYVLGAIALILVIVALLGRAWLYRLFKTTDKG